MKIELQETPPEHLYETQRLRKKEKENRAPFPFLGAIFLIGFIYFVFKAFATHGAM